MRSGIDEERAWQSATNGRGPWWNAGASHMNHAFPKTCFDQMGLVSLLGYHGDSRALHEPPDAEPYVRWCGRTAGVTPPPTRSLLSVRFWLRGVDLNHRPLGYEPY